MSQTSAKSEEQIDREMAEIIEDMIDDAVRDYGKSKVKYHIQAVEETPGARDIQEYILKKQAQFYAQMEKDLRENYINEYLCPEDFIMRYEDWYWPGNMEPRYTIQLMETDELQRRMATRYREVGQQLEFWFIYTGVI